MNQKNYFKKDRCRICESYSLEKVLELTPTPPGNNFLSKGELNKKEELFPLELDFCNDCKHIQLGHVVDPSFLFQNNYTYVSGTSSVFVNHLKKYADYVVDLFDIKTNSLIIDIGSNDGTCLEHFQKLGMNVLGIDPAEKIAKIASEKGIKTIPDFFSPKLANEIIANYGKAKLITSHNACAHIDDLGSVISGIEALLDDNGVFIMEVGYFVDVFENKWFDTIYHEHLDFHTVQPLIKLFDRFNMEVFRVERVSPQGGSIRVMTQKKNDSQSKDSSITQLIALEQELGLDEAKTFYNFQKQINEVRDSFISLITKIKNEGKTIAAFGAATKATTLSYHFQIDKHDIEFIVDENPLKQNVFSPGKHIPIYSAEKIYEKKPDYLVILAWNFSDAIMSNHKKYSDEGGAFILPMPIPKIIINE
jgi:SAM-dependent methyltransferase